MIKTEIHLTTEIKNEEEETNFLKVCREAGGKPILIELAAGQFRQQPMIGYRLAVNNQTELNEKISELREIFQKNGFSILRVKVEIPLSDYEYRSRLYPDFHDTYFEWHISLREEDIQQLVSNHTPLSIHVSRNRLRGRDGSKIVTLRAYNCSLPAFERGYIDVMERCFERHKIVPIKEEREFCVYDSNTALDARWINTPEITNRSYLTLLAAEAFLREASRIGAPFLLKGSLLTRQFFDQPADREVNDLDFLFLGEVQDDAAFMSSRLTEWVSRITESGSSADITLYKFADNAFWRAIDYAMADDFPTTNTDIYFRYRDNRDLILSLDVSWGLPLDVPPESIVYVPEIGEPFVVPLAAPLALQISWKLHQSVVRPRAKDILDLTVLLQHQRCTRPVVERALVAFNNECQKDGIDPSRLSAYRNGQIQTALAGWTNGQSRKFQYADGEIDLGQLQHITCTATEGYGVFCQDDRVMQSLGTLANLLEQMVP